MTWRFGLRLGAPAAAGFAAAAFFVNYLQAAAYSAAAIASMRADASILLPAPVSVDTVGGYVQWTGYGLLAVVVAAWAVMAGSWAARRDEETGLVEAVLATGVARADFLLARFLAFTTLAAGVAVFAALGLIAGAARTHASVAMGSLLGATAGLVALALACYSIALLAGQLTTGRTAAFVSATVVLGLFLLNRLGAVFDALRPWTWLSPFRYFEANQPLVAGGAFDVRAVEVLLAVAAGCGVVAMLGFERRDLGAPLWRPPSWPMPGALERRLGVVAASAGMVALAVILTAAVAHVAHATVLPRLVNTLYFARYFPVLLGSVWFALAALLVSGFAVVQVAGWAGDDAHGRLEAALAASASRTGLVLRRALALALATIAVVVPAGAAVGLASRGAGYDMSAADLAAATLLLVPVATCVGAVGAVLVSTIPRAAPGLLAAAVLAAYLAARLGPVLRWPAWVTRLSPFELYGAPLTQGVDAPSLAIMAAITVAGFAAAAFLMQRREVPA